MFSEISCAHNDGSTENLNIWKLILKICKDSDNTLHVHSKDKPINIGAGMNSCWMWDTYRMCEYIVRLQKKDKEMIYLQLIL
jgi:hypothetical protein